jgi:hypothetical protein
MRATALQSLKLSLALATALTAVGMVDQADAQTASGARAQSDDASAQEQRWLKYSPVSARRASRRAMERYCPADLSMPITGADKQEYVADLSDAEDVAARISGCHNQLISGVTAMSVRRSYHGAASATGAFGAAVGGAAAAVSTTQAWTLAGLLLVIVDDVGFGD